MFYKLFIASVTLLVLTACNKGFEVKNEIAFVIESHCEKEVAEYFEMLSKSNTFKTSIVPTSKSHSLFDSISYIGIIKTSSIDLALDSYALGSKKDCGSKNTGSFQKNGSDTIDSYVYQASNKKNKAIYIEVMGDNAKVYQ